MNPTAIPSFSWLPVQAYKAIDLAEIISRKAPEPILNPDMCQAIALPLSPPPGEGGDKDDPNTIVYLLVAFVVFAAVIYWKRERDSKRKQLDRLEDDLDKLLDHQDSIEKKKDELSNNIKTL